MPAVAVTDNTVIFGATYPVSPFWTYLVSAAVDHQGLPTLEFPTVTPSSCVASPPTT